MIAYFDTSALIPLLVEEFGTPTAVELWAAADERVSARLVQVEAPAALALAQRISRITRAQLADSLRSLDLLLGRLDLVEITASLTATAAGLAVSQQLRGYDAVHCAAALSVSSERLVAVAGDRDLLAAWHRLGLATADVGAPAGRPA